MKLSKTTLVILLILISTLGFMLKLPTVFRNFDTELHFLFYFCAALMINLLLKKEQYIYHIIIFVILFWFGIGIEIFQDLSNLFFEKKIHGNFDPRDIIYNTLGLIFASAFWLAYIILKKILGDSTKVNQFKN